jgi:phenylpyruvate tautomerase PptA (4-oxalocrotonate tautomerase family)
MTLVVLVLALVNRAGVGNTAIVAPRTQKNFVSRVSSMVATALSAPRDDEEYTGRLFGVECNCVLHRNGQYASLNLRGIPIGGWLSGTAWFQSDGASVVLDPALERAVARRMTSIMSARYQTADDTVHVLISIPVFGVSKIILQRKARGENVKV